VYALSNRENQQHSFIVLLLFDLPFSSGWESYRFFYHLMTFEGESSAYPLFRLAIDYERRASKISEYP
jgi:hypothetical protein